MQIFGLHKNIYRLARYAYQQESIDHTTQERKKLLGDWEILKARGVPDHEIAKVTGISRATYYRRKKALATYGLAGLKRRSTRPKQVRKSAIPPSTMALIKQLRHQNPTYGKNKITVLLKRDHALTLSESSVGRVLKKLIETQQIIRSISATPCKKRRRFKGYAQRWQYGMKAKKPGEMIQVDHMTVSKNGITMKHFQAWDPISKMIVADVVSNATSAAAAKFLKKAMGSFPFPVQSIQVDGGSELMKDFEHQCAKHHIPLYVLPPKRPQYNGGVERGNRIFREAFYAQPLIAESLGAFRAELAKALHKYNTYRPHFRLDGLTPFEYASNFLAA